MSPEKWSVSDPGKHGFDDWMTTQAEASNSMTNCGCFPKNHTHPGRKPNGGYDDLRPLGDQCVVGSGFKSDWCYPCTDYFYPNASDPRGVSALSESTKVPGDDSTFLIDRFELFLTKQIAAANPWLAHICFHAIHEPHPAMPEFWNMYATPGTNRGDPNYRDPDYLGALTMWDVQIGRLMSMLKEKNVADKTAIFYTAVSVASSCSYRPRPLTCSTDTLPYILNSSGLTAL
jgi:arylsulfatase A-like enzyme|eukprot:COSAG02_NODE_125_length_34972_cov_101.069997_7_plen_231_part_00